ncbi:Uncharacterised protein [Afipia felis]|uniref:Uncharacterized protein n=2 Tax=Afipia felis TaxID=1035 RepID=A0A380W7P2_AFIFE|nr:hypothetical protein HMPREF9697_03894 [Afipia felis ATCC 53690]SUU76108.1 Uncharacterised protein [Afipia felis]SUU84175.1 Uncharacterised protein [Afipia felis]
MWKRAVNAPNMGKQKPKRITNVPSMNAPRYFSINIYAMTESLHEIPCC